MIKELKENIKSAYRESVIPAFKVVAVLWVVYLGSFLLPFDLTPYGIWPRAVSLRSFSGIIFAPFIHGSFAHILGNTIPLFILLTISLAQDKQRALQAIAISWLASGIGIWFFGFSGPHIGASGVIVGLIGFLVLAGYYRRKFSTVLVSLGVMALFGGSILLMIIPLPGISWMGHFFGFLGGAFAAKNIK